MKLHEYQAKALFDQYGIPTTVNAVASTTQGALDEASKLDTERWVVKAQIHAGGRGKAGGVKIVDSVVEVEQFAQKILGSQLVTNQNQPLGQPVNTILIEVPTTIKHEFYLSALVERGVSKVMFIASVAGGMDIEEIAKSQPEKIVKIAVDPAVGLQSYQCRELAFALELFEQIRQLQKIMFSMYQLIIEKDLAMIEINPLVLNDNNEIIALDGKVTIDDNALYRQKTLVELRDPSQDDEHENKAQDIGLNYVRLDGTIACMVNGAGLAMATMDLIKLHGGEPANFLDVGGGTSAEKVAQAFKLILSDARVKSILVNIFGGIVRCDLIAEGIINAVKEVDIKVPVVVRLEGTNKDQGKEMLQASGLAIITAEDLTDAAKKAVHESKN
ncbi:Succinyl-CoA ligase [ADP-forming] beta chain [hydrothermal vent metagenome]|uniref:Succinyl-CoA ligase [ADP-forming] beta chain n=1 Tax=hydrothermal vent metagenome TaxID=652676 RepID=A0A3B1AY82_9ZZZZ